MSLSFLARTCPRAGRIPRHVTTIRLMSTESESSSSVHIMLANVPEFTTPADIRRAIERKVQGLTNVELEYNRFSPTGRALLTFMKPDYVQDSLRHLMGLTICGRGIASKRWVAQENQIPRTRGEKGRNEAIAREAVTGTGIRGNFPKIARSIVAWGYPGTIDVEVIENLYSDFKLARTKRGTAYISKLPKLPDHMFSVHSRFVITLNSEGEAYRLARHINMTLCPLTERHLLRAQALY